MSTKTYDFQVLKTEFLTDLINKAIYHALIHEDTFLHFDIKYHHGNQRTETKGGPVKKP